MNSIKSYHWPGNIRQLANTIERAAILEESGMIQEDSMMMPEPVNPVRTSSVDPIPESLEMGEKAHILRALRDNLWIQKDAAKVLGISPRTLNYKIKKFHISHPRWRKHK
jgi:two-component system response regulator AtoC